MEFVLAALFAVIAGFGTAFSPCVLPVLPLALGGAASGGRRRPLGIAIGLAGSFAFATLALAYVIAALGLPDDLLRTVAIVVAARLRRRACSCRRWRRGWRRSPSRLVRGRAGRRWVGTGSARAWSLGASLGLLYVPCAGPMLADGADRVRLPGAGRAAPGDRAGLRARARRSGVFIVLDGGPVAARPPAGERRAGCRWRWAS